MPKTTLKGFQFGPNAYRTVSSAPSPAVSSDDYIIGLQTSTAGSGFTVALPDSAQNPGKVLIFVDNQDNAHNRNVTLSASASGDNLNGVSNGTYVINIPGEAVVLVSFGAGWRII